MRLLQRREKVVGYAVRHGTTEFNAENKYRGNANPKLDAKGQRDAKRLAAIFKNIKLSAIICSNKDRAIETANEIARVKGMKVEKKPKLAPWDTGDFTGKKKTPDNEKQINYYIEHPNEKVPGGHALSDFKDEIRPIIKEGFALAKKKGAPILFVMHATGIHEIGDFISGDHEAALVEPGGIAVVCQDGKKLTVKAIYRPKKSLKTSETIS